MSTKTKSNVSSLLAAIQRAPSNPNPTVNTEAVIEQPTSATEPESRRRATRRPPTTVAKSRVGKPVQFWMHEEDRQLVRELGAWLAGQGFRSTDSLIIRAALRTAKIGGDLLEAYREAALLDGRLKQHRHTVESI
jgi:hypothetical protein